MSVFEIEESIKVREKKENNTRTGGGGGDKLSRAKDFPPLLISSVRVRDLLATEVADLTVCD